MVKEVVAEDAPLVQDVINYQQTGLFFIQPRLLIKIVLYI